MRSVKVYQQSWPLHSPFVFARGSRNQTDVVVVEIEEDGVLGVGECTPSPRYGESCASVMSLITTLIPALEAGMTRQSLQQQLCAGAARNALDCALWDLASRQQGVSLIQYFGQTLPAELITAQTITIDTPENMARRAMQLCLQGASILKVKLDDRLITERMVAIRSAAPDATLIVDANESWLGEGLAARCQFLADLNVAMLEQPLPANDDAALENFIHPLPICADESCHTRSNLKALSGRYEMVNIKLDKTGGLTEALALAEAAQSMGFSVMVGCMLCTSRAIAAVLPVTANAQFTDLDGPTWLEVDVEPALAYSTGLLRLKPESVIAQP